jgi:hypothetical protein
MRFAWLWFNRISSSIGLVFMLAEAMAWTCSSVQAGHVISFARFHQQFEQRLFGVFDRHDAVTDKGQGKRKE